MVKNFDVGVVYPLRTYERHQFCLSINGKEYRGDYYNDSIHWLHPHPKQNVDKEQLNLVEAEVHDILGYHGVSQDLEDIKVDRMFNKIHSPTQAHRFKLQTKGREFKGVCRDNQIDWFHPKPQDRLGHDEFEKLENKVYKRVKGIHLGLNE